MNIIIRFPDRDVERKALGKLARRFSGKAWANGDVMVPDDALPFLATQNISFTVVGPATYEQLTSLRNPAAVEV